jgi:hypothetical protein
MLTWTPSVRGMTVTVPRANGTKPGRPSAGLGSPHVDQVPDLGFLVGAGEGNRTLMTSLEGWGSAIELRPRGGYTRRNRKQAAKPVAYRLAAPD